MGVNYWGIFFFVMPMVVAILVGSITLMLVSIKQIHSLRRFKRRRF